MTSIRTSETQTGWCWSQSGKPIAYVVPLDRPGEGTFIEMSSWWEAMRFALSHAHNNDCEYVGGPEQ